MFDADERLLSPHTLQVTRPELSKAYPKCGTVQLAFNASGTLLFARFESTPHAIHLFTFHGGDLPHLRSVLLHTQPVISAQWNPSRKGVFAACCGEESVYMWSDEWEEDGADEAEEMAECIGVPASKPACPDCLTAFVLTVSDKLARQLRDPRHSLGTRWERHGFGGEGHVLLCLRSRRRWTYEGMI